MAEQGLLQKLGVFGKSVGRNLEKKILPYAVAGVLGVGAFFYSCEKEPIEPDLPENKPPTVYLSVDPTEGYAPLESRFKVWGKDPDGIEDIKKYSLKIPEKDINIKKSSPIDTVFIFPGKGNYTAKAKVIDYGGLSDTEETKISVYDPEKPNAILDVNPKEGTAPLETRIKVNGEHPKGFGIESYFWGFNDNEFKTSYPADTLLIFESPGNIDIYAYVKDSNKVASDTTKTSINIFEPPQPSVTQNATLEELVNIKYNVSFENLDTLKLDILKDGEKIFSRTITKLGYSELFTYNTHDEKITKGNYDFIARWKTLEGRDTLITASVKIPNYLPSVNLNNVNLEMDEESSIIVTLPVPTDTNPEDNPVSYRKAEPLNDKVSVSFKPENRELTVQGLEKKIGDYVLSFEFGSEKGGISTETRKGYLHDLLDISGFLQDNETHSYWPGIVRVYDGDILAKDTRGLGEISVNSNGEFSKKFPYRVEDLTENIFIQGRRKNSLGEPTSFIRTIKKPKGDIHGLEMIVVPYKPYSDNPEEFRDFVTELDHIISRTRFDFEGEYIENHPGLVRIRLLDYDYFSDGTFSKDRQELMKNKILDKDDLSGIIGNYNISPDKVVFGNDSTFTDYTVDSTLTRYNIVPSPGVIVVVPRSDLKNVREEPIGGLAKPYGVGSSLVSRGAIYIHTTRSWEGTISHEFGHIFITGRHPESLYGESVMATPSPIPKTGPADWKAGKLIYEKSFLINPAILGTTPHMDKHEHIVGMEWGVWNYEF